MLEQLVSNLSYEYKNADLTILTPDGKKKSYLLCTDIDKAFSSINKFTGNNLCTLECVWLKKSTANDHTLKYITLRYDALLCEITRGSSKQLNFLFSSDSIVKI